jgi:integrase/recombinase XerD
MFLIKNNKSSYYQIVYFVDGKRTTHSTKKTTKEEAHKYLQDFKISYTTAPKTITPIIQNEASLKSLTLSNFKEEYLEYVEPVKSKKYIYSISYSFKYFIDYAGDIELDKIETRTVDKFINATFTRTQRGAHLYYRTLKAALNKAVEWNYISINPFTKIKFPKISKSFPIFISEDELLIILANTQYEHLKDIFTVAFYTGLRLGELVNMRWNWLDFLQNQITVKCSDEFQTKSKKERIVPMSEKVRAILFKRYNMYLHNLDEIVFYSRRGKRLYQESISKQFKKIVRNANLNDKIHFHTLRHSFASLLVQKGVSLYVVKELLGHEDLATTQIYSHLDKNNLTNAIAMI